MKWIVCCLIWWIGLAAALADSEGRALLVVSGAPGEEEYRTRFEKITAEWRKFAAETGFAFSAISGGEGEEEKGALKARLESLPTEGDELWIVLFGHGSYDGRRAKFNLFGDDLTPPELAEMLRRFHRPLVLFQLFASSAPFLKPLAGDNRIVITSTHTERERNYSRFAEKLAEVLSKRDADLDGDGSVSLLETLRLASNETRTSYDQEQRLVTEHALIDDNGDGSGSDIEEWNSGESANPADGRKAGRIFSKRGAFEEGFPEDLRAPREALEKAIDNLRQQKAEMGEDAFYKTLEKLMREMAEIYRKAESRTTPGEIKPQRHGETEKSI